MILNRKTIYLLLIFGAVIFILIGANAFGTTQVSISKLLAEIATLVIVATWTAEALFAYKSEKIIFADPQIKYNRFNGLHKDSQPICRAKIVHDATITAKQTTDPATGKPQIIPATSKTPGEKLHIPALWCRGGYNAGINTSSNTLYFAPASMVRQYGNTFLFLGRKKQITHREFFETWIFRDENLFNTLVGKNTHTKIFVPEALRPHELRRLNTAPDILGISYPLDVDQKDTRFQQVSKWLAKRAKVNAAGHDRLKKLSTSALSDSNEILEGAKYNHITIKRSRENGVHFQRPRNNDDQEI